LELSILLLFEDLENFDLQWGGWGADGVKRAKRANGRMLFGKTWDGMPELFTPSYAA